MSNLCGVVYYIGVHRKVRGCGIGRKLLSYSEEYFVRNKAKFALASTVKENVVSRKFFSKMGYTEYLIKDLPEKIGWNHTRLILKRLFISNDDDVLLVKPLRVLIKDKNELIKLLVGKETHILA